MALPSFKDRDNINANVPCCPLGHISYHLTSNIFALQAGGHWFESNRACPLPHKRNQLKVEN
mgnify:CR=1 FL=1